MKTKFLLLSLMPAIVVLMVAAVVVQTECIYVLNTVDAETKLKLRSGTGQTAPFVECVKGGDSVFSVSANGGISTPSIQSGSVTTAGDGTVTNTFSTAFSAAPVVLAVQTGIDTTITNTITVTTTNFILVTQKASQVVKWVAIGTP